MKLTLEIECEPDARLDFSQYIDYLVAEVSKLHGVENAEVV